MLSKYDNKEDLYFEYILNPQSDEFEKVINIIKLNCTIISYLFKIKILVYKIKDNVLNTTIFN